MMIEFSKTIEIFFNSPVESVYDFMSPLEVNNRSMFTNYSFSFILRDGLPGRVELASITNNEPIFKIHVMSIDEPVYLYSYELEIIRPYIIDSIEDLERKYRDMVLLHDAYISKKIYCQTHSIYLRILEMFLPHYKRNVDWFNTLSFGRRKDINKLTENINLIRFNEKELTRVEDVNDKLIKGIILN